MPPKNKSRAKTYTKAGKKRKDKKAPTGTVELPHPPPPLTLPSKSKTKATPKAKYHHCYLLQSKVNRNKTYIGYTTNPERRLKQHNGILQGGAAQTSKYGGLYRPWEFVCVVGGFESEQFGLKFEWAWQHPNKSTIFRSGFDPTSSNTTANATATSNVVSGTENSNCGSNSKSESNNNSTLVGSNKALVDMVLKSSGRIGGLRRQLTILMILLCESNDYRAQNLTVNFVKSSNHTNSDDDHDHDHDDNDCGNDSSNKSNLRNSNEILFRELFRPCRGSIDDEHDNTEDNEFANWCKSLPPQMKCWTIPSLDVMPFAKKNTKNDKNSLKKRKRKEDVLPHEKDDINLSSADNTNCRIWNSTKRLLEGEAGTDNALEDDQDHDYGMNTNHSNDDDDDRSINFLLESSDNCDSGYDDGVDDDFGVGYNYNYGSQHCNQAQVLYDIQNLSLAGEEDEESNQQQLKGRKKGVRDYCNKKKKDSNIKGKDFNNHNGGRDNNGSNSNNNNNNVIDLLESGSSDNDETESKNDDNVRGTDSTNVNTKRNALSQMSSSCQSINNSDSISTSTIDLMPINFEHQCHGRQYNRTSNSNSNRGPIVPPVDTIDLTSPSSSEQNHFSYDLDSDSDNTIDLYST